MRWLSMLMMHPFYGTICPINVMDCRKHPLPPIFTWIYPRIKTEVCIPNKLQRCLHSPYLMKIKSQSTRYWLRDGPLCLGLSDDRPLVTAESPLQFWGRADNTFWDGGDQGIVTIMFRGKWRFFFFVVVRTEWLSSHCGYEIMKKI